MFQCCTSYESISPKKNFFLQNDKSQHSTLFLGNKCVSSATELSCSSNFPNTSQTSPIFVSSWPLNILWATTESDAVKLPNVGHDICLKWNQVSFILANGTCCCTYTENFRKKITNIMVNYKYPRIAYWYGKSRVAKTSICECMKTSCFELK